MAVRNRLEVTVLPQDFSKEQQEQARKNISAAAISATISKIESSDGTVSAEAYTAVDGSIHYNLKVSAEPVISDTEIYGTNGISAKNQGVKWTIGLSADYLTANALDNLSGNWQNTYNTVTNNSGNWNEVSSKLDTTAFSTVSSQFAIKTEVQKEFEQTSSWAVETFQPKGDYLSASEKYLSANALDDLSGKWNSVYDIAESYSSKWNDASATLFNNSGKWNSVYNTVDTNSANWGKGYNWIFDNSANIINASAILETNSGNWNSVYNTVETNSGNWENSYTALTSTSATWNNHSALSASKLDKSVFEEWSANADITEYSGVFPINISEHKVSIDLSAYYEKTETSGKDELNDRFEPIEADLDILKENSAHNVVESKNDYIKVSSGTNKFELEFLSGDLATKTWVEQVLSDFGGFVPADPTGADNHPNVDNPSNKKIYLVADATAPEPDKSREWIVTGEDPNTGWYCIGDTSLDLTPYVKISDISAASATWNNAYNWVYNNSANVVEASGVIKEVSSTFTAYSGKWNDASATLFNNSSNWNSVHDTVDSNSSKWENSYTALTSKSADWNEVSAKLDASESAKYMFLSDLKGTEDGKLSGYGSSAFYYPEIPEYSGKDGIKVEDYWITISADYLTANALDELSGNWEQSYTALTATSAKWDSVYTSVNENSASWNETSATVNTNSAKWNEASAFSANSGKFVTSAVADFTPGLAHVLTKDENDNVAWSGIDLSNLGKMYPITSLTPDIVSATISAVDGTSAYVLSAASAAEIPGISAENGVSARFDTDANEYVVGLEKSNLIAYGKFHSEINTFTTSAALTGYVQEDVIGDDIYIDNGTVYVNSGLYHIDIQTEVTVPGNDNNYYNAILKSTVSPTRQLQQEIDGSYEHTETIDLSFDSRYAVNDTELKFTIENLPVGSTIYVKNLNIHRIVCSLSEIVGSTYNAGEAIIIDPSNNAISVDYGDGLELSGNTLQVKLGEGLKFDETAGIKAITINNQVEEVVETVTEIANDLDTKVTSNFPPAMITVADADIAAYRNNGCLYGTLFNVAINSKIEIDRSVVGMYIYRVDNDMDVMFGLYEYQPDYERTDGSGTVTGYGRTVPLCDTGIVHLTTTTNGFTEFPIKHLNNTIGGEDPETKPSLKSSCMYYAAIYLGSNVNAGGLHIGSFGGYAPQFNNIKPGLSIYYDNINCNLTADYATTADNVSFNDFGFSWRYNSYADHYADADHTYTTGNYSERNDGYRFYMQIRNKAQEE